MAGDKAGQHVV